jgi:hypothetical protein
MNSMNRLRLGLFVPLLALVLTMMLPGRAAAQCALSYANGFTNASVLNNEGLKERASDVLITSGGAPNCFESGNVISVSYSGPLSLPTTLSTGSTNYIVITNPNATLDGTLGLIVTTSTVLTATGTATVIQMAVTGAGTTDPAASITLQNLRFNVTGFPGVALPPTPAILNVSVAGSALGLTAIQTEPVGFVLPTINLAASSVTVGAGIQSAGGPLAGPQATVNFQSLAGWPISPFRVAIPTPAYPLGCGATAPVPPGPCTDTVDIPTNATSLVIDIEDIPSGVAVTLPPTMSIWPGVGATVPTFQWKLRTSTSSAGIVQGIYDTVVATGNQASVSISTGAAAADAIPGSVGPPAVKPTPITIGVQINSASGNGTATIRIVFGPTPSAAFAGDDANAAAVPDYTQFISTGGVGREIITDSVINPKTGVDTATTNFFTIQPTQSVLLFPYVTDEDGYATGIAVANTGNDSVFANPATKGQTGSVTFYFFPTGVATPIVYQATATLLPGNVYANSLDGMLAASGSAGAALAGHFSGYVVALCEFDYGHGFDIIVNPNGVGTALSALYLGSSVRLDQPGGGLGQ